MGQVNSSDYDINTDSCGKYLESYLKCVESHKNGLTEGDDCSKENIEYKVCRKAEKDKLNKA